MRICFAACLLCVATTASAQIVRVAELNAAQIRALDRSKTVVMLTGGMLEQHGPYLPAYTDGILSERLTQEIARTVIAKKPGWTVLLFPQIPFGSTGSNDIGNQPSFPGTYTVRPSTLRAVFMDLASELGDQGFRWIMVVHVHGAPLHGGMDEHSLILHLRPDLVAPGYNSAPAITGQSQQESFDVAKKAGWPGYIGSPRLATAAFGEKIWNAFASAASDQTLKILDGADPSSIPRYADILEKNPLYQKEWIAPAKARDDALGAKEREWLQRKQR